jgi:hypothetical protein
MNVGTLLVGQIAYRPDQAGIVRASGWRTIRSRHFPESRRSAHCVGVDVARAVKRTRFDDLPQADLFDAVVHGIARFSLFEWMA